MQCPPAFFLIEADRSREASDIVALSRAWKLFLLLPRLLLHRPPRGGDIPKCRFSRGSPMLPQVDGPTSWSRVEFMPLKLLWRPVAVVVDRKVMICADGRIVRRLWCRWVNSLLDVLPSKVLLGNETTRRALTDQSRRPPEPREPLRDDLFERRGPWFSLDHDIIAKNTRVARRGAVAGFPG